MLLDPIQARILFSHALRNGYAVLAVNADSPAAVNDCLAAAAQCRAPIIIEASLWQLTGRSFGMGDPLLGIAQYLAHLAIMAETERFRDIPVLFHTDHLKGPETLSILKQAVAGIPLRMGGTEVAASPSTLSLDSSDMSDEENIASICELCRHAEESGRPATLEMEAGVDAGLTPPETTELLLGAVEKQHPGHVWLWAPGVGTQHGFSAGSFSPAHVESQRDLAARVTGREIGIALHGSSGLSTHDLREAVKAGVVKVNWSTESLYLRAAAAREYYARFGERLERGHANFKTTAMDNGLQEYVAEV
jgi:fructose/tagatose bisphosphate aldolase